MLKQLFLLLALCATVFAEEAAEEEVVVSTFSAEEQATIDASSETHAFEAEVSRLMDIIIHSLYSNRDIFLRELISNAADATDKIRFIGLTDVDALGDEELDIRIELDKEAKKLTITDKGVGMTRDELVTNLGVVAKSGTTDFVEAAASGEDPLSLIGQFGVGFYSVYLVADKVTVASKNNNDEQHVWESTADRTFTIAKDPRGNTLGRGTEITLYLKDDAEEFLGDSKITEVVQKYSQFINCPILLKEIKSVSKEVPIEESEEVNTEETPKEEGEDDIEVSEEEDEEAPEAPKTKTVTEEVVEWKRLNDFKAIWTRSPKEVTDEEYAEFYKSLDKKPEGALSHVHFNTEGEVSFKSLLYIQARGDPQRYNDIFALKKQGISLYVRQVLISDEFEDFLPRYMNFVKGVVDSDDLPINVSRETLAESRVLKVIGKKLVRKVLEELRKMSEEETEEKEKSDEEAAEKTVEENEDEDEDENQTTYEQFWEHHGKSIKFGVIDDRKNKAKLSKLLRYPTSKSNGKDISLETYVERMAEDQKHIYFLNCESIEKCEGSPFIEKALKKGYEVVYMTDVVDEYLVQHMTEFDGVEMQSCLRDNMKLDKEERKAFKQLKEEFKPTVEYLKELYGERVATVKVSNKLDQSPCVVTASQYGYTANMERIMKSQTFGSSGGFGSPKNLEINPRHPIMVAIKERVEDEDTASINHLAQLLLDGALVSSGFTVEDLGDFKHRMTAVVNKDLDIDAGRLVEEEVADPEEEEEEEEEEQEEQEEQEEEVELEEEAEEEAAPKEEL